MSVLLSVCKTNPLLFYCLNPFFYHLKSFIYEHGLVTFRRVSVSCFTGLATRFFFFNRNPTPPLKERGIARSLTLGRISENANIPDASSCFPTTSQRLDGIFAFNNKLNFVIKRVGQEFCL